VTLRRGQAAPPADQDWRPPWLLTLLLRIPRLQLPLLQIPFDFADRPGGSATRVFAELTPGPPLSHQVPALVKLLLDSPQLLVLLVRGQLTSGKPGTQVVLGLDEVIDGAEDFLVIHSLVLPCGFAHPATPALRFRGGVLPAVYVAAMQLSRKRIVAAGMKLIEANGVEAVSMRRLATELGCGVIALYNHVPSRRALLDAVADTVMSGIARTPQAGGTWADQLRAQARAFRQAARTHPRCAMVALAMVAQSMETRSMETPSRRPVSVSMTRPGQSTLAALREAGLSGPDEIRAGRAFAAYLAGSLLREVEAPTRLTGRDDRTDAPTRAGEAALRQSTGLSAQPPASDADRDFEFGLDLLIRAIATAWPSPREPLAG